jgi:hypothetical protein
MEQNNMYKLGLLVIAMLAVGVTLALTLPVGAQMTQGQWNAAYMGGMLGAQEAEYEAGLRSGNIPVHLSRRQQREVEQSRAQAVSAVEAMTPHRAEESAVNSWEQEHIYAFDKHDGVYGVAPDESKKRQVLRAAIDIVNNPAATEAQKAEAQKILDKLVEEEAAERKEAAEAKLAHDAALVDDATNRAR